MRGLGSQGQRDDLQVLVTLAGSGRLPGIVKNQTRIFRQAISKRLEISLIQGRLLFLESTSHDQQMVIDHVEFIQQANMRVGHIANIQVLFVGQERIVQPGHAALAGLFAGEIGQFAHQEIDAVLADDFRFRR